MILKKLLGPTDLSRAQTFYIYKATKVVIVYKNKYLILATFQIVMPCLKDFENS